MNRRLLGAIIVAATTVLLVTIQQAALFAVDEAIGPDQVQVIATDAAGKPIWHFGLWPELELVPKTVVPDGAVVWAKAGDYAGASVLGITAAIAAVMYAVWLGICLGFPFRIEKAPARVTGLASVALLTILTNLIFARMMADATTGGTVIANTSAHLSLSLNNAGIFFAILMHRLGIGVKDASLAITGQVRAEMRRYRYRQFYKKYYAIFAGFILVGLIEVVLIANKMTVPEYAVDFSVWLILAVIFLGHFGVYPSDWLKGARPKGLAMLAGGIVGTILVFVGLQALTDGTIGAGVLSERLEAAGVGANAGLSLMITCWGVFWVVIASLAGYCDATVPTPAPIAQRLGLPTLAESLEARSKSL